MEIKVKSYFIGGQMVWDFSFDRMVIGGVSGVTPRRVAKHFGGEYIAHEKRIVAPDANIKPAAIFDMPKIWHERR